MDQLTAIVGPRQPRRWLLAALALLAVVLVFGVWRLAHIDAAPQLVRQVNVSGLQPTDAREIVATVTTAAVGQRQGAVGAAKLRAALAPFVQVRGVTVSTRPAGVLDVSVDEELPVADLTSPAGTTAVTADGTVLGTGLVSAHFPTLAVSSLPSGRVQDPQLLAQLGLLGFAPVVLLHRAARIYSGPLGVTVAMRNGLLIIFGDLTRPRAKWLAAEDVIADSHSAGAWYVDVREPDRPAAGGLPLAQAPATGAATTEATLSAALEAAVTGAAATANPDASVFAPSIGTSTGTQGTSSATAGASPTAAGASQSTSGGSSSAGSSAATAPGATTTSGGSTSTTGGSLPLGDLPPGSASGGASPSGSATSTGAGATPGATSGDATSSGASSGDSTSGNTSGGGASSGTASSGDSTSSDPSSSNTSSDNASSSVPSSTGSPGGDTSNGDPTSGTGAGGSSAPSSGAAQAAPSSDSPAARPSGGAGAPSASTGG